MGGKCSTYGEARDVYRVLAWKTEGKRPLGRSRRRWEDNIKMDLQEVDWIDLAQDRARWRALVNAVMNRRVHSHNPRSSCHRCCAMHCLVAFPVLPFTTVFSSPPTCLQTLIHFTVSAHVICARRSLIYANRLLQVEPDQCYRADN